MSHLAGYRIGAELSAGFDTTLYRGHRDEDHAPVTLKLLRDSEQGGELNARALARLEHEYALLKDLALPGVVRTRGLVKHGLGRALVLEDLGGELLRESLTGKPLDLLFALQVASSVADVLDSLHSLQIIHKDIKPDSIAVQAETRSAKLLDFGIAARVSREMRSAEKPEILQGTLSYLSPEQTGRMNRNIDSRTDLYSLGVTLYEMLTGVLPFASMAPADLVFSHIARNPLPPRKVSSRIPPIVSDITMKLLSKAAEDRYQSARGLKADLDECLAQLSVTEQILDFPLGRYDWTGKLDLPQKLYGREDECAALASAWDRVKLGAAELVLVSGYPGVGKSALIEEMHKYIAGGPGYFVKGKFEALGGGIPYAPLGQAFREMVRNVLAAPRETLARWKSRLLDCVGSNGRILIDIIPELELVVGPQPSVPELGPTESQNRFALTFQKFLRAFTIGEHPVAIFLDDLHGADPASLKLVESLLSDPMRGHLLVIGAYRDSEALGAHPFMSTVERVRNAGVKVSDIPLHPLSASAVAGFVADALRSEKDEVAPLAELCFEKTQGNPFFLSQFLGTLEREKLLAWDESAGRWVWDHRRIAEQMVTDNVIDFMSSRIRRLPERTRDVLRLGACIGHSFDLSVVAAIREISVAEAARDLEAGLEEGLVLRLDAEDRFSDGAEEAEEKGIASSRFQFVHDRVQQAAHSLVERDEKDSLHLRIGRLLFARANGQLRDDALFDVANHFKLGAAHITSRDERIATARMHLLAGKKAKASAAYVSAAEYFRAGLGMLDESCWESEYDLSFALHMERAECEYVNGAFDAAEASFDVLLAHSKSTMEVGRVQQLRIVLLTAVGAFDKAYALGRSALSASGIDLPATEEDARKVADAELEALRAELTRRGIDDLLHAPRMKDPGKQLTSAILARLVSPAFFTGPSSYSVVITNILKLSLEYGHSDAAPAAFASYAVILYGWLSVHKESYDFGKLGLDLCERFGATEQRCEVLFLFAHVVAFYKPLRSSLGYLEEAISAGLESGDLPYVSYSAWLHLDHRLGLGDPLHAVDAEADQYLALMRRTKNPVTSAVLTISKQMSANLRGRTRTRSTLSDDTFDEAAFEATLGEPGFALALGWFHTVKMELFALHGDHENALKTGLVAEEKSANAKGFHTETDRCFFLCLTYTALYPSRNEEEQREILSALEAQERKLASWAEGSRENFLHKKLIVDAERARIEGDELRAINLYEEAIELARQNGFFHHEAIANELAAKFHLDKGRRKIAAMHMVDAHEGYLRWGATAKAEDLAEKYEDLLGLWAAAPRERDRESMEATTSAILDADTISRAAYTIASEIVLDKVLEQLMRIVIEGAGAQRGVLLLSQDGRLTIEATITVDPDEVRVGPPMPAEASEDVALSIVNYVERTGEPVVLGDAGRSSRFASDPFIAAHSPKSLLCIAMMHRGKLTGILYLENNTATDVFTRARIELCRILSTQAAIAVENALLVARLRTTSDELRRNNEALEERISSRTEELRETNDKLVRELGERERAEAEREKLQQEIIHAQKVRFSEMSTPLIPITDKIMVMPLIGVMDESRAAQMLEMALQGAQKTGAEVVILDITGVRVVDTRVACTLVSTASALRLLGTQVVLTGVRAEVAQTLVDLNIDLRAIVTKASLQSGIAYALRRSPEAWFTQDNPKPRRDR